MRVLALFLLFAAPITYAQDRCDVVLKHGVFNEAMAEGGPLTYTYKEVKQRFCSRVVTSVEEEIAFGLSALLRNIPVTYDADKESYAEFQQALCQQDWQQYYGRANHLAKLQAAAADNRAQAVEWSQCMANDGVQLSYSIISDAAFVVRMVLNGDAAETVNFLDTELSIRPANAAHCESISGTMGANISLHCRRLSGGPIALLARTSGGPQALVIPSKPKSSNRSVYFEPWNTVATLHAKGAVPRGVWSAYSRCPEGSFATAFRSRVEPFQARGQYDDTGLNAVQLRCHATTNTVATTLRALEGEFGAWSEWVSCPGGTVLSAYQLKHHPQQWSGDDVGALAVHFGCRSLSSKNRVRRARLKSENEIPWGEYLPVSSCPANSGICALSTRYLPYQGRTITDQFDDVSLSDIRFECCSLPDS